MSECVCVGVSLFSTLASCVNYLRTLWVVGELLFRFSPLFAACSTGPPMRLVKVKMKQCKDRRACVQASLCFDGRSNDAAGASCVSE